MFVRRFDSCSRCVELKPFLQCFVPSVLQGVKLVSCSLEGDFLAPDEKLLDLGLIRSCDRSRLPVGFRCLANY
jgi:hypothetical protein